MPDTDQDSRNLPPEGGSSPSAGTPQGEEENRPESSVTELARMARRAFEDRRWGECLALTRTIREIDSTHRGAREIESWIRSDLEADLLNAHALLEETTPRVREERAQFLLSRILSVDFDHPEANALLLEVASRMSASDAGFRASPRAEAEPAGERDRMDRVSAQRTAPPAPPPTFAERLPQRRRDALASPSPRPGSLFADTLREAEPYSGHGGRRPKTSKKAVAAGVGSVVLAIVVVASGIRYQDQLVEIVSALTTAPAGAADAAAPPEQQQPPQEIPAGLGEEIAAATEPPGDPARLDLVVVPGTGVAVRVDGGPFQPVPPFLDLRPGSHTLEFEADGFEPHTTSAEVSAGERRVVAVVLNPSGAGSGDFVAGGTGSGTAPTPPPAAVEVPAAAPPPPPEVTLQINARPWAQVFLDGPELEPLGQTPLGNVRVPAGSVLVFRNPAFPDKRHEVAASDETIQVAFP